jgi:tRNA pseudouridine55 synthase
VYELARKGIDVKLDPRPVTIYSFQITKVQMPEVHFKVVCSTGTYIRSLANDFGEKLGCGGYLSSLCRTRIGDFKLEEAMSVEDFQNKIGAEKSAGE